MADKQTEKQMAIKNLADFSEVIRNHGIENFVLDGGTLLGAYRDNDFCEDDHNDIDLTTLEKDIDFLPILEDLGKIGFYLVHAWRRNDVAPHTTAQIAVMRNRLKIDLMFKEVKKDKAWWTVYGGPNRVTYKAVPAKFYQKTKEFEFYGMKFLIPKDTEGYLQGRYGVWQKKVNRRDYSCYKTDKAIKQSYEEI